MKDTLAPRLSEVLAPVVEEAGLHLEAVETTRAGRYSTVRVVVDLLDGPGDLDLDSLTEVTRAVSRALDEADPVPGQFTLEVSTPGAERELSTARHFRRAVGHRARVTTPQGEVTGLVRGADSTHLTLEVDGEPLTIAVADVTAARMVAVL
ncbi:ribosome maturation factor RimP [Actinomyces howellii]|uniref:Ribosome maturation factor RimP n=1 Tax=Actinomyces howellii TaxID=52771 RepID=A0A448HF52_9ACTO|nr:ribosome maturation factor RimP [Actinomyces howellii]VEG26894.1 Ribosome maturation factor RimP [Actinomyces howellii]